MTFETFFHQIHAIKSTELLGIEAHEVMVPIERRPYLDVESFKERQPRISAVMMLLYPKEGDTSLLLIERATYKGVHSGQVGFPGGKFEQSDVDLETTALRETMEEVGITANHIEVIKPFSQVYIPPSNFIVQPFLGVITETPIIIPSDYEVANIIEMPLNTLLDDSIVQNVYLQTSYADYINVPAFVYNDYTIWGATAMMLSELKETMKQLIQI